MFDAAPEVLISLIENKSFSYECIDEAKHDLEYYYDSHPKTEQSDEMSLLQDQLAFAKKLAYTADLASIDTMKNYLDALDAYTDSYSAYSSGANNLATPKMFDVISNSIPLILTYCKIFMKKD